jgi:hypothetical protein
MRFTIFSTALIALFILGFTPAQPFMEPANTKAPWVFIGDKNVGFGVDHDVIHTGNRKDDFRQLKIKVTDGPLIIYDLKIHFDRGGVQDVPVRKTIRQGGESRVIDLEGGLRHLQKIEFWYETKGFARGKSRVALWGRK